MVPTEGGEEEGRRMARCSAAGEDEMYRAQVCFKAGISDIIKPIKSGEQVESLHT